MPFMDCLPSTKELLRQCFYNIEIACWYSVVGENFLRGVTDTLKQTVLIDGEPHVWCTQGKHFKVHEGCSLVSWDEFRCADCQLQSIVGRPSLEISWPKGGSDVP